MTGSILRSALDRLYLLSGWLAGAIMVAMFLLMMVMSAGRQVGLNVPAGDDFVAWCMAASAFLGLAHTFKCGEMIRVGLLIDRLSGRWRHVFEIASLAVALGFVGFFAWHAVAMTWYSWRFNDVAQGVLAVPLWIPQTAYSGGLAVLTIALADEFLHVLTGGRPRYAKPPPATPGEAVEDAIQSVG